MTENFKVLRDLSQKVDHNIQKLERTWESPHLLMGGHGENDEDVSPYLERFVTDLKNVQDQLIDDRESRIKNINSTEEFLKGVENFYDDLKQQCDDVESMLSDYGYKPLEEEESLPTDESETETSILTASQMDHSSGLDSAIENETDLFATPRYNLNQPKSIATPVITSLASAMKLMKNRETNGNPSHGQTHDELYTPLLKLSNEKNKKY